MTTTTTRELPITLEGAVYKLRPDPGHPGVHQVVDEATGTLTGLVSVVPSGRLGSGTLEVFVLGTEFRIAYLIPYGTSWVTAQTPIRSR
jgi:hypothetical protein